MRHPRIEAWLQLARTSDTGGEDEARSSIVPELQARTHNNRIQDATSVLDIDEDEADEPSHTSLTAPSLIRQATSRTASNHRAAPAAAEPALKRQDSWFALLRFNGWSSSDAHGTDDARMTAAEAIKAVCRARDSWKVMRYDVQAQLDMPRPRGSSGLALPIQAAEMDWTTELGGDSMNTDSLSTSLTSPTSASWSVPSSPSASPLPVSSSMRVDRAAEEHGWSLAPSECRQPEERTTDLHSVSEAHESLILSEMESSPKSDMLTSSTTSSSAGRGGSEGGTAARRDASLSAAGGEAITGPVSTSKLSLSTSVAARGGRFQRRFDCVTTG